MDELWTDEVRGEFDRRLNRVISIVEELNDHMIDPNRQVPLVVGNTTYTLYAGNKALRMIERELGKPIDDIFSELNKGSIDVITAALWGMLQRYHPDITMDDTDDLIDIAGYEAVGTALSAAANRAFDTGDPDDVSGKAVALNGATPGTGKRSSRTGSRPA